MDVPPRDPALDALDALVGEWDTEGTHPQLEGTFRGRSSFEWLAGRTFLIQRSEWPANTVPSSIAVIGGGATPGTWPMNYFDQRGIARVYQLSFRDGELKMWRDDDASFRQRMTGALTDGGRTLRIAGELAENGGPFQPDLVITYRRR